MHATITRDRRMDIAALCEPEAAAPDAYDLEVQTQRRRMSHLVAALPHRARPHPGPPPRPRAARVWRGIQAAAGLPARQPARACGHQSALSHHAQPQQQQQQQYSAPIRSRPQLSVVRENEELQHQHTPISVLSTVALASSSSSSSLSLANCKPPQSKKRSRRMSNSERGNLYRSRRKDYVDCLEGEVQELKQEVQGL